MTEMGSEVSKEVVYGPICYAGRYKLPADFDWVDESSRIAIRRSDRKVFTAEREIDVSYMWSSESPNIMPHATQPKMQLVLTED